MGPVNHWDYIAEKWKREDVLHVHNDCLTFKKVSNYVDMATIPSGLGNCKDEDENDEIDNMNWK